MHMLRMAAAISAAADAASHWRRDRLPRRAFRTGESGDSVRTGTAGASVGSNMFTRSFYYVIRV
jgi:hypothetical protein